MSLPPIRANPAVTPGLARPQPTDLPARTAAQRAFFDAALGRAGAPTVAPADVKVTTLAPDKPLRPGSLLDIRV